MLIRAKHDRIYSYWLKAFLPVMLRPYRYLHIYLQNIYLQNLTKFIDKIGMIPSTYVQNYSIPLPMFPQILSGNLLQLLSHQPHHLLTPVPS